MRKRLLALALVVVASVGLAGLAAWGGNLTGVDALENKTLDWRQNTTTESFQSGRGKNHSDVVLVLFDSLSVRKWPYLVPFPRQVLANLIDAVAGAGARTIGLDVYLDRLYDHAGEVAGSDTTMQRSMAKADTALHDAIRRAGNVILVGPVEQTDSGPSIAQPSPFFRDVAAGVGGAGLPTSFETFRDGTLATRTADGLDPSFALALYANARRIDVDSLLDASRQAGHILLPGLPASVGTIPRRWYDWWKDRTVRLDNEDAVPFTLRFAGPPSSSIATDPPGTFQAVSSSLASDVAMLDPDFFKGKIVLMGTGFHDSDKFRTPFYDQPAPPDSAGGAQRKYHWMYGVEIHANALQDMLSKQYVRSLGAGGETLLLLVMTLMAGTVAFWKGAWWGGAATVLVVAGEIVAAWWIWAGQAYGPLGLDIHLGARFLWMPVVAPGLAAVLSYVGAVAYVSVVEGKEKRFIKGAFGKYVSPAVVAEIAEHPEMLQLGGQKTPLTLLFSDLAGFTSISERMDPQDLLAHLNEYLSSMTQIVLDEKGTLDKYIGDAIMAFWNAPKEVPDHADRALRTAVLMQRRMHELNVKWREADPHAEVLEVRIGINTGMVVVGNMGGEDKFNYSAIGDAVNLASRLEPANKSYDTLVMASEFTLERATPGAFRTREIDLIAVKGKEEPVKVYEVLELAGVAFTAEREEALRQYQAGLEAYKRRDWELAVTYFEAALEADPEDGPSGVFLHRAMEYAAEPPPADWDFVVRRTVK